MCKETDTLMIFNTYLPFHGKNGYANAPPFYLTRTLPVLLFVAV